MLADKLAVGFFGGYKLEQYRTTVFRRMGDRPGLLERVMTWLKLTREDGSEAHVNMDFIIQVIPWQKDGRTMSALLSTVPRMDGSPWSTVVQEDPRQIFSRLTRLNRDVKTEPV